MVAPQHEEGGRVTDLQGPQVQHTLQHKRTIQLNHIQWKIHIYIHVYVAVPGRNSVAYFDCIAMFETL